VNQACSGTIRACYYNDNNHPDIPADPNAMYNDHVTELDKFLYELENHKPDRVYDWMD